MDRESNPRIRLQMLKPGMAANPRKPHNLAMQIYAALLGNAPKIARRSISIPRLKIRLWVETAVSSAVESPFHKPTFREQVERIAAGAMLAMGDAGSRLRRARLRSTTPRPRIDRPEAGGPDRPGSDAFDAPTRRIKYAATSPKSRSEAA